MNIRVSVCPRSTRWRNRSRKLPASSQLPSAGCASEKLRLSCRFLLAMRHRAASASRSRPWEYNQRGDSGMDLKETPSKAVHSYRYIRTRRRQIPHAGHGPQATSGFHVSLELDSPNDMREREGYRGQLSTAANVNNGLFYEWKPKTCFQSCSEKSRLCIYFFSLIFNWRKIALQYCVGYYQTSTWRIYFSENFNILIAIYNYKLYT